jgi:hypothetical protein
MDRIQKIKYKRLTPAERYLFDILNSSDITIREDKRDNNYLLNNNIILTRKKDINFFFNIHDDIWFVLTQTYLIRHEDLQVFIRKVVSLLNK